MGMLSVWVALLHTTQRYVAHFPTLIARLQRLCAVLYAYEII